MCWSLASPEIELTPPPESPKTAMTQAVLPAAEEPKTTILDKLMEVAAPTSALTVNLTPLAGVAESGAQASVPKLAPTSTGSAESGAQAQAAAPEVPRTPPYLGMCIEMLKEELEWIEFQVDLM